MATHSSILARRTPWTVWKGKKLWHPKVSSLHDTYWKVCMQYATGEDQRAIMNRCRKDYVGWTKQGWHLAVDVSGDQRKVWCYKEQYCIGTWNVRPTNQGKLDVVKQEMTRINIHILGISELKWMGKGKFNSDDHYIYIISKGRNPLEGME